MPAFTDLKIQFNENDKMKTMKRLFKAAFIDIDWTVLDHYIHDWDYDSIEAIKKIQKMGVQIIFVTARSYASVKGTGLFNLITPNGIITNNGGLTFYNDEILYKKTIPEDLVKKALEVANKNDVVLQFATLKDRHFTNEPNDYVRQYYSVYHEEWPVIRKDYVSDVTEIIAFVPNEYDEKLTKELPIELKYYRYDTYGVNVSYFTNKKGDAIIKLLNYLNIDKENTLAFGDSQDDISMFEAVGFSVAMGNSKDDLVKEKATIVTDTISNHGVASIIANLFF